MKSYTYYVTHIKGILCISFFIQLHKYRKLTTLTTLTTLTPDTDASVGGVECSFCVVSLAFPAKRGIFAGVNWKNLHHIMSKKVLVFDGKMPVYRTLEDASADFGVSAGAISMAANGCKEVCGMRVRWADRVYVVRLKDRRHVLAVKDQHGRSFLCIDGLWKIGKRDIDWVRDITASWYYPKEEQ